MRQCSVPGLHPTLGPEGFHLIVQEGLEMLFLLQQLPLLTFKRLDLLIDDVTKTFSADERRLGYHCSTQAETSGTEEFQKPTERLHSI